MANKGRSALSGVAAGVFVEPGYRNFKHRKRLGEAFNAMAQRPGESLPKKFVSRSPLSAFYEFCNHPDVTSNIALAAHVGSTVEKLARLRGRVVIAHDTTTLDYSGLDIAELGQIGDGNGRGVMAHSSLAIDPATRRAVGLLGQILHVRADVPAGESRAARLARPDRESLLWPDAVRAIPPLPEGIEPVDVCDRGADTLEFIAYEVASGRQFVVRSQHNRRVKPSAKSATAEQQITRLHDTLRATPAMGTRELAVQPGEGRAGRVATLEAAWLAVEVVPPRQPRGQHASTPVAINAVIFREAATPADGEPLEWMLLTNLPVTDLATAVEIADLYACRWVIEEYHKAFKTGCGVETLQLTTMHGLTNTITLLAVLAVVVLQVRTLARDPATASEPACEHHEELAVQIVAADRRLGDWRKVTCHDYFVAIARMGGYVANPKKRPPGWQTLWCGLIRLHDMLRGARLAQEQYERK